MKTRILSSVEVAAILKNTDGQRNVSILVPVPSEPVEGFTGQRRTSRAVPVHINDDGTVDFTPDGQVTPASVRGRLLKTYLTPSRG